ncbi:putative hydrolase [Nakamurella panacisegetis]|uniref:Putative hydrolase n=1 Tax=Nakamurella panacisegetis TaxID=1090615 RepID=A0A1H0S5K9_9ACTN|nr:PHP domain-containing protein [Nakamurella panacisegetis]SDP37032.1 putative hydrolase [Nakamurella panacisegetis]
MTLNAAPGRPPADAPTRPDLRSDHHVHSTFSDDAVSTLDENVRAAARAGLHTIRLVDHVRSSTTWVPEFLAEVATLAGGGITLLTGVETKMLDASGRLDLPPDLPLGTNGLDRVLIADHQFPGRGGPWSPSETLRRRADGMAGSDLVDMLITASIRAMHLVPRPQLAHPFSILPKVGLSESDIGTDHLTALGTAAVATGCLIEVNEKWACPGPEALRVLLDAGATCVASTDSHAASSIGRYPRVEDILGATAGERP